MREIAALHEMGFINSLDGYFDLPIEVLADVRLVWEADSMKRRHDSRGAS